MKRYGFLKGKDRVWIEADDMIVAADVFQERFGYFPDVSSVEVNYPESELEYPYGRGNQGPGTGPDGERLI